MTRSTRCLWIAAAGLAFASAAIAAEPAATAAPPAPAAAPAAQEEMCTDTGVDPKQRDAALRDLGERLSALPPAPRQGYRVLNRTGLNYGSRRTDPAAQAAPAPPPAKTAP